ncbi:MAG: HEAT repeat domain-containing protein [Pirellulaceae bacterium]|nr:HEAT repeat domain-containing protein [Pirellulaceae bacterium]
MKDSHWAVRREAAVALDRMRASEPATISALIEATIDENTDVHVASMDAITNLGLPTKTTVSKLIEALNDETVEVREAAIHSRENMGAEAASAIPKLVDMLKDEDADIRLAAIDALNLLMGAEATKASRGWNIFVTAIGSL